MAGAGGLITTVRRRAVGHLQYGGRGGDGGRECDVLPVYGVSALRDQSVVGVTPTDSCRWSYCLALAVLWGGRIEGALCTDVVQSTEQSGQVFDAVLVGFIGVTALRQFVKAPDLPVADDAILVV